MLSKIKKNIKNVNILINKKNNNINKKTKKNYFAFWLL